jgi:hypothetical protein
MIGQRTIDTGQSCGPFRWQNPIFKAISWGKEGKKPPDILGIPNAMSAGMDNNVNKASISLLAMTALVVAAIAAKLRATVDAQAPEGYEDASGFHFGAPNIEE